MTRICLRVTTLALAGPLLAWSPAALAYRPFDGTDAAVADPGEMEIEFQPAGTIRQDGETTLIAPATVLNFGLPHDWEAVLESQT